MKKKISNLTDTTLQGKEEIMKKLKEITLEDGSNIVGNNQILSVEINETGKALITLKLDQNYRKLKGLCNQKLQEIPWLKDFEIKMAPKVQNIFQF